MLTAPVAVVVELAVMSVWPLLIGDRAGPEEVAGQIATVLGLFHGGVPANILGGLGSVLVLVATVLARWEEPLYGEQLVRERPRNP